MRNYVVCGTSRGRWSSRRSRRRAAEGGDGRRGAERGCRSVDNDHVYARATLLRPVYTMPLTGFAELTDEWSPSRRGGLKKHSESFGKLEIYWGKKIDSPFVLTSSCFFLFFRCALFLHCAKRSFTVSEKMVVDKNFDMFALRKQQNSEFVPYFS